MWKEKDCIQMLRTWISTPNTASLANIVVQKFDKNLFQCNVLKVLSLCLLCTCRVGTIGLFLSLLAIGIGLVGVQMHLQLESVQVSVFGSKFPAVVAVLMASEAYVVAAV